MEEVLRSHFVREENTVSLSMYFKFALSKNGNGKEFSRIDLDVWMRWLMNWRFLKNAGMKVSGICSLKDCAMNGLVRAFVMGSPGCAMRILA
jgi:hypothetical protein